MKYTQINEGLTFGDLEGLVLPRLSIAEYSPKTGNEEDVIVIGFYIKDDKPADDLASFIEKGAVEVLDTEVSPNPDDDGNYLLFVEMKNEKLMDTVLRLLEDINRIVKIEDWTFNFYEGKSVEISLKKIESYFKNNG
tara:strand:- start:999 stop:1409 length:411 start_codon:yes stop_codon:yes gene_type:complete